MTAPSSIEPTRFPNDQLESASPALLPDDHVVGGAEGFVEGQRLREFGLGHGAMLAGSARLRRTTRHL